MCWLAFVFHLMEFQVRFLLGVSDFTLGFCSREMAVFDFLFDLFGILAHGLNLPVYVVSGTCSQLKKQFLHHANRGHPLTPTF